MTEKKRESSEVMTFFIITGFGKPKEFGMPNGSGWYNEAPWVVDFLKSFNRVERENEQFTIQKSKRK